MLRVRWRSAGERTTAAVLSVVTTLVSPVAVAAEPGPAAGPAAAPASDAARSDDGAAELSALRTMGAGETLAVSTVEATRGLELEWGVPLEGAPDVPGGAPRAEGPAEGPASDGASFDDVIGQADLGVVRRDGTRKLKTGLYLSIFGGLFGVGTFAGTISALREPEEKKVPAIVFGSLTAVFFAMIGAGIPLAIKGRRMSRHPEQYVRRASRFGLAVTTDGVGLKF